MSASVLAASAGALVEQIGSYAGYASIIGLGVMALLYFTQAREVKRLREWAGREPERAAELAQRVQADPNRRVVAQPLQPSTAAAQQQATAALYASVGATPPPGVAPPPGQLARPTPTPVPVPVPRRRRAGRPVRRPAVLRRAGAGGCPLRRARRGSPPRRSRRTATPAGADPDADARAGSRRRRERRRPPPPRPRRRPLPPAPPPASRSPSAAPIYANGAVNQDTRESAAARPGPLRSLAGPTTRTTAGASPPVASPRSSWAASPPWPSRSCS